jgi:hypothetical protein
MLAILVSILSHLGLSLLGQLFKTTAETTQAHGIDNSVFQYLVDLVSSAESNSALKDGGAKYDWVFNQAVSYFSSHGIDLAITYLDDVLSMAVHHFHKSTGITGQTISGYLAAQQSAAPAAGKP